jgi:hypothetical protein
MDVHKLDCGPEEQKERDEPNEQIANPRVLCTNSTNSSHSNCHYSSRWRVCQLGARGCRRYKRLSVTIPAHFKARSESLPAREAGSISPQGERRLDRERSAETEAVVHGSLRGNSRLCRPVRSRDLIGVFLLPIRFSLQSLWIARGRAFIAWLSTGPQASSMQTLRLRPHLNTRGEPACLTYNLLRFFSYYCFWLASPNSWATSL